MGTRIGHRLLDAGHGLRVWNRTPQKAESLVAAGATRAATAAEAARGAPVVVTMVADGPVLRSVLLGADGIVDALGPGATLIDMSTIGQALAAELPALVPDGARALDAPVLGSLSEAEQGTLRIFVGGPPEVFASCKPLLSVLGSPVHLGGAGAGAAAKLVANASLFGTLGVLGEVIALGEGMGLSRDAVFETLAATPLAQQAERRRPVLDARPGSTRFALALAHKDARLIGEAAAAAGLDLRLAEAARSWLADAERGGWGDADYSAVLRWILGATGSGD